MKMNLDLIMRDIAGETFLVPVGKAAQKFPGMFALNEVGAFTWKHLEQVEDIDQLVEMICSEYDVTPEEARKDTESFLGELKKMGIID